MKSGKKVAARKAVSKSSPKTVVQPKGPCSVLPANGRISVAKGDPSQTIRILVVDDHPLFRHGLVQLLSSDEGFSVCGESGNAPEALSMIRRLNPNLVIAD